MNNLLLAGTLAVFAGTPAFAQTAQPPPTYETTILNTWKGLHGKILTMAKDFPEEKFGWKPHPDSRSMIDEFRHVTIGLEMSTAQLTGEKFDYNARLKADVAPGTKGQGNLIRHHANRLPGGVDLETFFASWR